MYLISTLPHMKGAKVDVRGVHYQLDNDGIVEVVDPEACNILLANSTWIKYFGDKYPTNKLVSRVPIRNPVAVKQDKMEQGEGNLVADKQAGKQEEKIKYSAMNRKDLIRLCEYKKVPRKLSELNQMRKDDLIALLEGK
jgi:hypothetical protein